MPVVRFQGVEKPGTLLLKVKGCFYIYENDKKHQKLYP